ncbi:MAG: hypothetical protein HY060_10385 [Proteobacteria bacterium]|nr:hypothetical protein [Pseudomonadota bacterium]
MRFPGQVAAMLSLALFGLGVTGCAALITGKTEEITIASEPTGAQCRVERMAQPVAVVKSTPETIRIPRSRYPLDVYCTKDTNAGAAIVPPSLNLVTFLGLFGPPTYLVDSFLDADRSQPEAIVVRFPMSR